MQIRNLALSLMILAPSLGATATNQEVKNENKAQNKHEQHLDNQDIQDEQGIEFYKTEIFQSFIKALGCALFTFCLLGVRIYFRYKNKGSVKIIGITGIIIFFAVLPFFKSFISYYFLYKWISLPGVYILLNFLLTLVASIILLFIDKTVLEKAIRIPVFGPKIFFVSYIFFVLRNFAIFILYSAIIDFIIWLYNHKEVEEIQAKAKEKKDKPTSLNEIGKNSMIF